MHCCVTCVLRKTLIAKTERNSKRHQLLFGIFPRFSDFRRYVICECTKCSSIFRLMEQLISDGNFRKKSTPIFSILGECVLPTPFFCCSLGKLLAMLAGAARQKITIFQSKSENHFVIKESHGFDQIFWTVEFLITF